ncbi:unnamed protein product [marine sediment metagenome]|uniref:Uncharacterized protein n=1 Tax=marine sediment metagenome TaxID=412755 RepID=X1CWK2_9ZZZZ
MGMIKSLTDREYQKFKEAADDSPAVQTYSINQLIPEQFDAITLSYDTDSNLTSAEYFTEGTGGTQVATLTLSYSDSTLTSVEKS